MHNKKEIVENKEFQQNKISKLNRFFMKSIIIGNLYTILVFIIAIGLLLFILFMKDLDSEIKITLISMIATYILTTSKTIIDKCISTGQYLTALLSEEQRGLNKDLGIDVDKIDFENLIDNQKVD